MFQQTTSTDDDGTRCCEDVFAINTDGTNEVRLTTGLEGLQLNPAWSPDGTKIVFRGPTIMNADDSGVTPIHFPGGTAPDWQPIPGPQRSGYKNASQFCKAERDFLEEAGFRQRHGGGANAHGKCVSGK